MHPILDKNCAGTGTAQATRAATPTCATNATHPTSYTTKQMAELAGVTERTLRHYDAIGLLCPQREENGYRSYGEVEVDRLQRILLLVRAGIPLARIRELLDDPSLDQLALLREQLEALRRQRQQVDTIIATVERTIGALEGGGTIMDSQKFEGLKRSLVEENERAYGAEVRERFGEDVAEASNARVLGMTQERYDQVKSLEKTIAEKLVSAMETGDPSSPEAREVVELHAEWLRAFWPDGTYTKKAHAGLAEAYVADDRFRSYYDAIKPGAAQFLRDAIVSATRDPAC